MVLSCPFLLGNQKAYWWFGDLGGENKHIPKEIISELESIGEEKYFNLLQNPNILSPWMVGGQTMSVCWNGSVWAQSWVGRVCRGTLCWVRPGMLMVACW